MHMSQDMILRQKEEKVTLKVGVRRPFSTVNGSATNVMAFANSKPLNCTCLEQSIKIYQADWN